MNGKYIGDKFTDNRGFRKLKKQIGINLLATIGLVAEAHTHEKGNSSFRRAVGSNYRFLVDLAEKFYPDSEVALFEEAYHKAIHKPEEFKHIP